MKMKSLLQTCILLLGCYLFRPIGGQLIGSRGIFTIPEGQIYRDAETVDASESVARFARAFQPSADREAESNRIYGRRPTKSPRFYTSSAAGTGRELGDVEVFDFVDSRYLDPLPETKFNKPLEELEIERNTPRTRVLPGRPSPAGPITGGSFGLLAPQFGSFRTDATPAVQFGTVNRPRIQSLPSVQQSSLPSHRFSSSFAVGGRQPKQLPSFGVQRPIAGNFNFFSFNNQRIY